MCRSSAIASGITVNRVPRLSEGEFKATISEPPRRVAPEEAPPFDFWPYFDSMPQSEWGGRDFSGGTVSDAYVMSGDRWEHVLVASGDRNVKLVLVLDLERTEVLGHYILDLNRAYGIDQ